MKKCNADASAKFLKGGRAQVVYERVLEGREEVLAIPDHAAVCSRRWPLLLRPS
jgi:hypothetical protein